MKKRYAFAGVELELFIPEQWIYEEERLLKSFQVDDVKEPHQFHMDIVKELITREQYPAPKFWINPEIKDFYDFTTDDIKLIDYETGPQVKDIPIAI